MLDPFTEPLAQAHFWHWKKIYLEMFSLHFMRGGKIIKWTKKTAQGQDNIFCSYNSIFPFLFFYASWWFSENFFKGGKVNEINYKKTFCEVLAVNFLISFYLMTSCTDFFVKFFLLTFLSSLRTQDLNIFYSALYEFCWARSRGLENTWMIKIIGISRTKGLLSYQRCCH